MQEVRDMIELINEDCQIGMARYPNKWFDLACIDAPYGIGESMNKNQSRSRLTIAKSYGYKEWDEQPPSPEYFIELFRISKNQIIWGANHFISRIPFDSSCWIVWDKVNGDNDFADCELAWTSFNSAVRKVTFMWAGMLQGKSINEGFVQQGNKELNEVRIHPTQKPVKLYEWLLKNYAKKGDKILDTHGGSFSSAIAAYNLDFEFVGFEIDVDYFQAAKNRLNNHMKQKRLFDETNNVKIGGE